ncbi:MAG: type I-E CRISPR-associated protein Cas5/CasD [Anaerolineae bacterium]|jgi:CRISPR system Cascade subunit CasD|nr:type I-E CRISPR-associated protein Cas5/CasD [Anaerolineae bacterium]
MTTLLLRLSAPMQSWGYQSHFEHRDTAREPTKSGIVGLLCAALGRARHEPLHDLAALRMGVRVDQEGAIRRDWHTAGMGGIYKVSGGVKDSLMTSQRYYLTDAKFLVGLEGPPDLLETLHAALQRPRWLLCLGRRACIPAERIWLPDGLQPAELETTLTTYTTWRGYPNQVERLRYVIEEAGGSLTRSDQPVSFAPRRFLPRRMQMKYLPPPFAAEEA